MILLSNKITYYSLKLMLIPFVLLFSLLSFSESLSDNKGEPFSGDPVV